MADDRRHQSSLGYCKKDRIGARSRRLTTCESAYDERISIRQNGEQHPHKTRRSLTCGYGRLLIALCCRSPQPDRLLIPPPVHAACRDLPISSATCFCVVSQIW